MASPVVFVTGGNGGIGAAICKLLVSDRGCKVFMGSRSVEKGQNAVKEMGLGDKAGDITVIQCDVNSDESVKNAAATVKSALGDQKLFGLVNNAGTGLGHGTGDKDLFNTNVHGPKRVCDNFMSLMDPEKGRIVNMGSGAGPGFVKSIKDVAVKKQMCSGDTTWADIEDLMKRFLDGGGEPIFGGEKSMFNGSYGLSKAALTVFTMQMAAKHPNIKSSCVSPGYIQTNMTKKFGSGGLTPEQGTVSTMRCLFDDLPANGLFFGSDGLRSPIHVSRNPGEPEYDGKPPVFE